jgi:hypothetical protein
MFQVTAGVDCSAVLRLLDESNIVAERAAASAMNKAAAKARTQAVRTIASELGVPVRLVRKRFRLWKATTKRLSVSLNMLTKRIPAILSGDYRWSRKTGVTGGKKTYSSAWIMASKRSGRRHIFRRDGQDHLPISSEWIEVVQQMVKFEIWRRLNEQAPTVAAELERQIVHRMNRTIGLERHEAARPGVIVSPAEDFSPDNVGWVG